jgi:hypothetical protein
MAKISYFVTFAVVLGPTLVACGGEDFQEPGLGEVPGSEETSSESQPVWGPTVRGRAAISLDGGRCSGVLLNNRTFLTAAHCVRASPASVVIGYQGPTVNTSWTRTVDFTKHPNYVGGSPAEWDIAVGTFGTPLNGITADDYATIRRNGGLGGGRQVEQAGYGGTLSGSLGVQARINLAVTWNGSHHAKWETVVSTGQMICSGDSGGPGFRHSGYTDSSGGRKWDVVAWVMKGFLSDGPAGVCDDEGRATYVYDKVDWIRGIVQAVTPYTCTNFTTPSGEPAAWCWAAQ